MKPPINLPSSSDEDSLVNAIRLANDENQVLILGAGPHLTKPGKNLKIKINGNGLHIKGSLSAGEYSSIKRPDSAIILDNYDFNYGLYFIPSEPTDKEWSMTPGPWKTYSDFEYKVIIRGAITIENLELDCNMGNQGLPENIPGENRPEHSTMLGFAGQKYQHPTMANRYIYVGFEIVTIKHLQTVRGGYADDIWISRGYFRPNIRKVVIDNITSDINNLINPRPRINKKRATISFSGLAQNIEITNAKIYKLESEDTTTLHWNAMPGEDLTADNQYSFWKLKNIACESLDLAAKGKSIFVDADNIVTSASASLYQVGGMIQNSVFNLLGEVTVLNRLNNLIFTNVTWLFSAYQNSEGYFFGIYPNLQKNSTEPCMAKFIYNFFIVKGALTINNAPPKNFLIHSESAVAGSVDLEFLNCFYDKRFVRDEIDNTYIGDIRTRGKWKFTVADFRGISTDKVLRIITGASQTTGGGILEITVP